MYTPCHLSLNQVSCFLFRIFIFWVDGVLRLFNSISVISRRYVVCNRRLGARESSFANETALNI